MSDPSLQTTHLHAYVQRWQAGDAEAANELFQRIGQRLEQLARRMLHSYPNVRCWVDAEDIYQGAACRLLRTLRKLQPACTRDFFQLAALHIRRELLDLARRYSGKQLPGTGPQLDENSELAPASDDSVSPSELELWARFHEAVEKLEDEAREVFSLYFYHGWTHAQIAELFEVNERTIRRRWNAACVQLGRLVGGQLPSV